MPTVEVLVNGRRHAVQCGPGEDARVRQLASWVDRRIADMARGQAQVGDARLLLLVTLKIADELSDAFEEIKQLRAAVERQDGGGEHKAAAALERAAQQIDAIAAELESA
jgi:cell division protein ZapA